MTATQNSLFDVVSALSAVTGWVGTYRGADAVFTRSPVPPQVDGNYIVVRDSFTDVPGIGETKTSRGRLVVHDIAVYKTADGDPSDVQDVAEAIRDALHRNQIPVSGYGNALIVKAFGPVEADNDQVYGRIVTVSLELIKA